MYAWSQRVARKLEGIHCAILAFSTFLSGLYFGRAIPEGGDLLILQSSLVGVILFLVLTHLSAVRHLKQVEDSEACHVEERLSRLTEPTTMRIDGARQHQAACHFSAKPADQKTTTVQSDPA